MRELSYAEAILEAHVQLLRHDPTVFAIGQGVWSPWYVGTSMKDLDKEFGKERIIDTPVSENATTGVAIGAALAGMRPILIHPRMDFMILAADQIVNEAANWSHMFGGRANIPLVIRPIINRGGEQGAQHSQALHAWFTHVPGIKVVMPATAYDAKGLFIAAVQDNNPVMYIDDRWLYSETSDVPEEMYTVPIGKAAIQREGADITVVAISSMLPHALRAADEVAQHGITVEVIDPRSLTPLDTDTIVTSVKKTGHLIVADSGWLTCGVAAEIAARIADEAFYWLKAPIKRVALPDCPAPTSGPLEQAYYPDSTHIINAIQQIIA